jgi:hypothetical protein
MRQHNAVARTEPNILKELDKTTRQSWRHAVASVGKHVYRLAASPIFADRGIWLSARSQGGRDPANCWSASEVG